MYCTVLYSISTMTGNTEHYSTRSKRGPLANNLAQLLPRSDFVEPTELERAPLYANKKDIRPHHTSRLLRLEPNHSAHKQHRD